MKVLAFSIITNRIVTEFDADEIVDHNEVVAVANKKALEAEKLVSYFISNVLNESNLLD
jgi:purine nucleoside phosphorylase